MRRVDRTVIGAPASLTDSRRRGALELKRARTYFARRPRPKKAFTFLAYKEDDVRHALEALFHGKCAYCERRYNVSGPVDIEHFRPKGKVEEDLGHPGYWWLAAVWTNLLPSCLDCNRRRFQATPDSLSSLTGVLEMQRQNKLQKIKTGKDACFPIVGARMSAEPPAGGLSLAMAAEEALLIDPCSDDPDEHISFHIDRQDPLGVVYAAPAGAGATGTLPALSEKSRDVEFAARLAGISVRGAVSIQTYGLNRLALVQERTRILRRLETLGYIVIELSSAADALGQLTLSADGDVVLRQKAQDQLRGVVARTLADIRAMAQPDAPFSRMVAEWIEAFKRDMAV